MAVQLVKRNQPCGAEEIDAGNLDDQVPPGRCDGSQSIDKAMHCTHVQFTVQMGDSVDDWPSAQPIHCRTNSQTDGAHRLTLYNIATLITVTIGVAVLHVALFISMLFAASITIPPAVYARTVGHPVSVADYLSLAWLVASIATVGGALGSGLEDDDGVRAAAYGVRQRQRFDK
jgi:hypothetical protein